MTLDSLQDFHAEKQEDGKKLELAMVELTDSGYRFVRLAHLDDAKLALPFLEELDRVHHPRYQMRRHGP